MAGNLTQAREGKRFLGAGVVWVSGSALQLKATGAGRAGAKQPEGLPWPRKIALLAPDGAAREGCLWCHGGGDSRQARGQRARLQCWRLREVR